MAATDDELEAIEDTVIDTVTAGVTSVSSDGFSASAMDPMKQLDVIERLENRTAVQSGNIVSRLLRNTVKLVSPGGGGG